MQDFVNRYINRCVPCLYYKTPSGKGEEFLHPLSKGDRPFHSVHIDHLGPFVTTATNNKYAVALICGFSKYVIIKAVTDSSADEMVQFLREATAHYGRPERIISDRGAAYTPQMFKEFCTSLQIGHLKIATATPRGSGQVERLNRGLLHCLATVTENPDCRDWDLRLYEIQFAVNSTRHRVT